MTRHRSTGPLEDLHRAETSDGDRVLLHWQDGEWTVREFSAAARSVAEHLGELGIRPGDRVAIMARNSERSLAATYGTWMAGAVEVAVNTELRGPLLRHVLDDSDPTLLVASNDL